jgi:hypothetical protein
MSFLWHVKLEMHTPYFRHMFFSLFHILLFILRMGIRNVMMYICFHNKLTNEKFYHVIFWIFTREIWNAYTILSTQLWHRLIQDFKFFQDFISTLIQLHCNNMQHLYNNIIMVNKVNLQREKNHTEY